MRDEIQAGLKNALERGYTLEDSIKSFISAGYNPVEVKEAASSLDPNIIIIEPLKKKMDPALQSGTNNQSNPAAMQSFSSQTPSSPLSSPLNKDIQQQPLQSSQNPQAQQTPQSQQLQQTQQAQQNPRYPADQMQSVPQQQLPTKQYPDFAPPKRKTNTKLIAILFIILLLLIAGIITLMFFAGELLKTFFA